MAGIEVVILMALILVVASLYSSVGHAGASGYLAAMALVGMAPEEMKPTALLLNIVVASIGSFRFARAGHFHFRTFWPFAVTAIPMAYVGGWWHLPAHLFQPLIGAVLLFAAAMLVLRIRASRHRQKTEAVRIDDDALRTRSPETPPPIAIALPLGAALGLLAGLTGTGGGIFLSPLLILMAWADPKRTAAVSVVFVLVNSIAGITGHLGGIAHIPGEVPLYIVAAVIGGVIGSSFGASSRTGGEIIRLLLAIVLIIAAMKMLLSTVMG